MQYLSYFYDIFAKWDLKKTANEVRMFDSFEWGEDFTCQIISRSK